MTGIWRFPSAVKSDPDVNRWFEQPPRELKQIALQWFTIMRQCGNDVLELLHDGYPTACAGELAFAYVNSFTSHVNVGFYYGALLPDPDGILEGTGKRMRHVKIRPGGEVNIEALKKLIKVSYKYAKQRTKS